MRAIKYIAIAALAAVGGIVAVQGGSAQGPNVVVDAKARVTPALAAAALPAQPAAQAGQRDLTADDVNVWLDGYLPYALRSADIPGAVVVVVKDGKILSERGFGYADAEKRLPVDPEKTLFRPGSISKLFTWTAVMQMVEAGKLNLDTDVNTYLDFKIPPRDGKPVTLRQIMTHTAGFEEVAKGVAFNDQKYLIPLDQYLKRWIPQRIFAPGTTPAYSNWATALAGYMVQRVSGEEFNAYLEHHIFAPLDMKNATFRQPLPANLAGQMSVGYRPGKAIPFEFVGPAPAGSAAVSGGDMGRFMIAHLNNGAGLLQPATAEMMHNSPLDKVDPMSILPPLSRMELGFFETNLNGREVIGHLGDLNGFHSSLHLFMKEGVGVYFSFNSPGKEGAVQGLRTALFQDFADRYFPNIAPADGRVDAKTAAEHARMMTGTWWASRRGESTFLSGFYALFAQDQISVNAKGELVIPSIKGPGGRPREWVEISPFLWRDKNGHDRLAAKVVDGKIVRWSFDFASPFEVFDRVPGYKSSAWIQPMLYISLTILLITLLIWPIAWIARRVFKAAAPLSGRSLKAYRASRLMAGLVVVLLVGWMVALQSVLSDADASAGGGDGLLLFLEAAGILIFVGAVLTAGWNLWQTWTDGRRWLRKVWSVLILLATLMTLYFAVIFNLMHVSAMY